MRSSIKMVALFGAVALVAIVALSGGAAAMGISGPHMSPRMGSHGMNGNGMMGPTYTPPTQQPPVSPQAPVAPQPNPAPTGYPGMMAPGYNGPAAQQTPTQSQVVNTPAPTVQTYPTPMHGWMSGMHIGMHVGAEAAVYDHGMHW